MMRRSLFCCVSGLLLSAPLIGFSMPIEDKLMQEQELSVFIIGGQDTSSNQLPFFARVLLHQAGAEQFLNICGGSIINNRFILTAAHCVEPSVFQHGWTRDDLRVLVKNPTMNDVFTEEFKKVKSITLHPNYEADNLWLNDIAILELVHPITDNVASITLPQDFGDYSDQSTYQIFGLGQTSSNDIAGPIHLRWAEIQPLTDAACSSYIPNFHSQESLCANGFVGRDYTGVCDGDSGGPLTYQDSQGSYHQIGIVSYGSTICELKTIPSVFTEILNYNPWIEAVSNSGEKTVYDPQLAEKEDYHSKGDTGVSPNTNGSKGGSIDWVMLILGGILGTVRKRIFIDC